MLREMLQWFFVAVPVAAALLAVAITVLIASELSPPMSRANTWIDPAGFLFLQTLAPIALWVPITRRWPQLRRSLGEALLFPLVVAAIGFALLAASSDPLWPSSRSALGVSVLAWLGFSWAILVSRTLSDRFGPSRMRRTRRC